MAHGAPLDGWMPFYGCSLGLQPPPEKMVGVGAKGVEYHRSPEDMGQDPQGFHGYRLELLSKHAYLPRKAPI